MRAQVFSMGTEVDPADIAKAALARAEELSAETGKPFTLIVDTAGRQVVDGPLMEELARVKQAVGPDETLLVVSHSVTPVTQSLGHSVTR